MWKLTEYMRLLIVAIGYTGVAWVFFFYLQEHMFLGLVLLLVVVYGTQLYHFIKNKLSFLVDKKGIT